MNCVMRPKRILLVSLFFILCSCSGPESETGVTYSKNEWRIAPFVEVDDWVQKRALGGNNEDLKGEQLFEKIEGPSIGIDFHNQLNDENFDYVFYIAGVDIHLNDRLGKLKVSEEGIRKRDEIVTENFFSKGIPLTLRSTFSGSNTGKSFLSTGIILPSSLYKIGIGHPQYLCLEIPQSLSL